MNFILLVLVLVGMIIGTYFTSGLSNGPGTIFERKNSIEKKAK